MILLVPAGVLFISCVLLFFREVRLDSERFLEEHRLADEHILREVVRFLKECRHCEDQKVL